MRWRSWVPDSEAFPGPLADERGPAGGSTHEMVDVTDEQGRVVGAVPRHEMRAQKLPHRCTIVIQLMIDAAPGADETGGRGAKRHTEDVEGWFESIAAWTERPQMYDGPEPHLDQLVSIPADTPVVVHQRAAWKDVYPGYWDLAFGGVVGAGEPWLPSARRELEEEAGLSQVPIVPVGAGRYEDDQGLEFAGIFVAMTSGQPVPNDGEVVAIDYVAANQLVRWAEGRDVCCDSTALVLPILDHIIN